MRIARSQLPAIRSSWASLRPSSTLTSGWRRLNSGISGATKRLPKDRSEEHTSELQSLMRISYAVFCLKKKKIIQSKTQEQQQQINKTISTTEQKQSTPIMNNNTNELINKV